MPSFCWQTRIELMGFAEQEMPEVTEDNLIVTLWRLRQSGHVERRKVITGKNLWALYEWKLCQ